MLEDKIRRKMVAAISDYTLLEDGDRIMVAVSGGKDSTIMLLMLEEIRKRSKVSFSLFPVILDQKQPGFTAHEYQIWLKNQGFDLTILEQNTYAVVKEKTESGNAYCALCSRLRRGVLYNYAHQQGYNKIALGHHRDDLNETILMNMFFTGRFSGMPPKLLSDDERNIVIRPMAYVPEKMVADLAVEMQIPIIPCNLCGSQDDLKRQQMKELLSHLEEKYPGLAGNMLAAQKNIRPSQLLDKKLWSFSAI